MKIFFCATVIVSFLIFAFAILRFWIGRNLLWKKISDGDNKAGLSKALCFSGYLLLSIFFLRFAVGICAEPEKGAPILNGFEQFVESFFRSLRTFGIEEEYPKLIGQLKNLIANQFWEGLAVVYSSLLEIIAPISGGAIILEILSSVLPKVRLYLSFFRLGKRKYCYFNELNAPSIALAKSIISEGAGAKKTPQPVVIFADAYVDREDEKEYELFLEAKQLGAICVRDDLAHIRKPFCWRKHREYYLMDENEFGNLQSLARLVDPRNVKYIKGAFIYLFVQSDAYVQIEKNIQKEIGKLFPGEDEKPRIVPVRGYRNLVQNLLQEVPLYEPLISKENKDDLNVTILGNGLIGTEAFLSVYWLGQMLVSEIGTVPKQCGVTVNVVSKDDEETFWSKIDYVNPEIQKTVEKIQADSSDSMKKTCTENAKELCSNCPAQTASQKSNLDDGLLSYNKKGEKNLPYCKVRYVKSDLKIDGFWDAETEEIGGILSSDYFIVALGNDADNISIAEKIRSNIGKKHIEEYQKKVFNRTVITYAVFDSELAKTLNEEKCFKSVLKQEGDFDIYTYAFGSLEDVYSCKNVYLSKHNIWATVSGKSSDSNDTHRLDNLDRIGRELQKYENSNYDYWANLAKALHVKYKVFSLGWIRNSVFCSSEKNKFESLQKKNQETCALYLKLAAISALEKTDLLSKDEMAMYQDLQQKKHYLAWLEHRRWNAFTRTMGYRQVDIQKILAGVAAQKDMRLKLHSCLVEAEFPNNPERDNCYMWMEKDCAETDDENLDALDRVSKEKKCDYKEYDYCAHELGDISSEEVLQEKLSNLQLI